MGAHEMKIACTTTFAKKQMPSISHRCGYRRYCCAPSEFLREVPGLTRARERARYQGAAGAPALPRPPAPDGDAANALLPWKKRAPAHALAPLPRCPPPALTKAHPSSGALLSPLAPCAPLVDACCENQSCTPCRRAPTCAKPRSAVERKPLGPALFCSPPESASMLEGSALPAWSAWTRARCPCCLCACLAAGRASR